MSCELFVRKSILFLILLLLPLSIFAHFFESDLATDKRIIETLTKKYPLAKTNDQLKTLLAQELQPLNLKNSKSPEVIANVFVANKTSDDLDELNPTSTHLFKKALLTSKELNRKDLELWVTVQYGFYLYTYRKYETSFPLFMHAIKDLDELAIEQIIQPVETYKKISFFLMTVGDYQKANEYLLLAKKYAEPNSSELASITDNLGLNNSYQNDLTRAEKYFKEALAIASAVKDTLRYAKALGNIAEIKFKQKNYKQAIDLLNRDIAISKQLDNTQNTIYALVLLSKTYLAIGNTAEAYEKLQLAKKYATTKTYLKSSAYQINTLILAIAKQTGNTTEELTARRNLEELKDALTHLDGKDAITKVGWQMEKKKLELNIQEEKAEREKETLIKVITLIGCVLLIVLIAFLVRHFQQKIKNEKADYDKKILSIRLDKVNSEQKLNANHQTLESYKTYLDEKNNQIEKLEIEISIIKKSSAVHLETYTTKMQDLLASHLMDNNSWLDFKKLFTQTYPTYNQFLLLNFADLTDSHLRIIFLTKLEMNNIETARILGLTIDAVKKAKQRLKKKYGDRYDLLFGQKDVEV